MIEVLATATRQLIAAGIADYAVTDTFGSDVLYLDRSDTYFAPGTHGTCLWQFDVSGVDFTYVSDATFAVQIADNAPTTGLKHTIKHFTPAWPSAPSTLSQAFVNASAGSVYLLATEFPITQGVDKWYSYVLGSDQITSLLTELQDAKAGSGLFNVSLPNNVLGTHGPLSLWQGTAGRGYPKLVLTETVTADDPFTLVYNGLWDCLESSPLFVAKTPAGNRVKLASGGPRLTYKQTLSEMDTPEVRIVQSGGTPLFENTSNSTMVRERYEVQVFSGGPLYHQKLNPVKWAILNALHNWRDYLVPLTYRGQRFVHSVRPVEVSEFGDEDRGLLGWTSVWSAEVHMNFSRMGMTA